MTTLVLPGWQGSGPDHWQCRWLDIVDGAVAVRQRDWQRPTLDEWLATAAEAVRRHPGSLVVAHSLGAVLVAHLARRLPGLDIAGALLVAPADVDRRAADHPDLAAFAPIPTTVLPFPSVVVGSRNDPWMSFARAAHFARSWGADLVDAGEAGHINADSGLGNWPFGLGQLSRLALRAGQPWPTFSTAAAGGNAPALRLAAGAK